MREILFKGKRKDNGEWVEGDTYLHDPDLETVCIGGYDYYTNEEGLQREEYCCEVDPSTVCQYTGLTDKNGRKIFEGDIVKIPSFKPDTMAIGFIEGAFCLVNSENKYVADIHYINHANDNQTEVIGNIFDNPELIGE